MQWLSRVVRVAGIGGVLYLNACSIPYVVGSTARPVAEGQFMTTGSFFAVPHGVNLRGDSLISSNRGLDLEARMGVSDRSDVGARLVSFSGMVLTWKRRLDAPTADAHAATAIMLGGGFLDFGDHLEVEATLLHSTHEYRRFTAYGGLRVVQGAPLVSTAIHHTPTAGGFVGARIGTTTFGLSPEIGVFYDKAPSQLRSRNVVVVPSISLHGDLFTLVGRVIGMLPR